MESDRELLELAAKAAGIAVEWREWTTSRIAEFGCIKYTKHEGFWFGGKQWNPLTDDGDALRLAIRMGMNIDISPGRVVEASYLVEDATRCLRFDELMAPDPYAATRRAIVRGSR